MSTDNFAAAFARAAARQPDRVAVVDDTRRVSFAELDQLGRSVAAGLEARGVGPGDVVTSQLSNCIEAYALCLGVNHVGAVHNPVVAIYREREVGFIRRQASSAVFVDDPGDDLFARTSPGAARPASPTDREPSFLLYTSGSTADPKGVQHSDRTLIAECAAQAGFHGLDASDVFVIPSPVGHISGLLYGVLLPAWLGATSVLMGTWDPDRFVALIERERGTFSGGAPPFLRAVLEHRGRGPVDLSSLRAFPCGGADVDPELIRRVTQDVGVRTGRGYGSTEFPSITSSAGPGEPERRRAETDGRPIGANEIRIVDGEIQARGPELFLGYRDASLDADAFTGDGWFRTGDMGVIDEAGYLTVTGRLKDVVIRSGEKISAREVEQLLEGHPDVLDVAVVARPDPRTGEQACVVVVPRNPGDPPTLAELCSFLREAGLSTRKLPESLELTDALPMTAAGKVDKRALREPRTRSGDHP